MIKFDKLWITMKEKNISTYKLRESCGIDSKTIRRLKANENIETKTLDKICQALHCRIEDVAEFVEWYLWIFQIENLQVCDVIGRLKLYTTKKYGAKIWQRSFHDHIIRGEDDYLKI